jgi:hypothetical protein
MILVVPARFFLGVVTTFCSRLVQAYGWLFGCFWHVMFRFCDQFVQPL